MRGLSVVRLVIVSALAFTLGLAGTVLAGHLAEASYTGCLNVRSGALYDVNAGDTPLRPCKSGDLEVHLSGGDITAVTAGTGLVGGGASGGVSLAIDYAALDARYQAAGSKAADSDLFDGLDSTAFAAAGHQHDDRYYTETELQTSGAANVHWGNLTNVPTGFADGVDNDTTYTAGFGLTLSGNEFSVNTAAVQARVSGTCAIGSSIRVINSDGSVLCETDTDSGTFLHSATYTKSFTTEGSGVVPNLGAQLSCDPGDLLLSGGLMGVDVGTHVQTSVPSSPTTWFAFWTNDATLDSITIHILCANQ